MIVRAAAIAAAVMAALVAATPAFPWLEADTPLGEVSISGFGASGALWTLPILGGVALAVAIGLAITQPPRFGPEAWWGGGALVALAALAAFWSLAVALDPPVAVVVADGAVNRSVSFPVQREPALVIAPVSSGLLAAAGALIGWPRAGL